MSLWAIGDMHGNIDNYEDQLRRIKRADSSAVTLMVGDMGVGFKGVRYPVVGPNDYWIAGNHDDALVCERANKVQKHQGYLGDFGVMQLMGRKLFYLRGAFSTDRAMRTEGVNWWAHEELSYAKLSEAVALYNKEKPDIVLTHDCPFEIRGRWFSYRESGVTIQALSHMLGVHRPKVWIFGHHHKQRNDVYQGTHFYCIGDQQHKLIKL